MDITNAPANAAPHAPYTELRTVAYCTAGFVAGVNVKMIEYYKNTFSNLAPAQIAVQKGGIKFTRIVKLRDGQTESVFCFIDKANGDILKAEGWKKPAKHARGSVMAEDFGVSKVGPYGPAYMGALAADCFQV